MMQTEFTPYAGLIGGFLIGLSAIILMAGNGRILGASGIFTNLLTVNFDRNFAWRLVFIVCMLLGTAWTAIFTGIAHEMAFATSPVLTAIGGVIVGVGVYLGNGCTSGHGICGNARFSLRSFVATCVFMIVSIITVYVIRHVIGA
jgi:uncharacterized membrane protein YedE/YeeE